MGIDAEMFVRSTAKHTEEEVRKIAWEMCAVFGVDNFDVRRDGPYARHALEIVDKYEQDGPTIKPRKGETFIRVFLATRYWGPGYERGNLALILAVAEWLERKFPKGAVWYGGDSSGVCAEPLDKAARSKLMDHAASAHGVDYHVGHGRYPSGETCEFCNVSMSEYRWGGGSTGYICLGCNLYRLVPTSGPATEAVGRWPDGVPDRNDKRKRAVASPQP
jgi:hypothetical protein